MVQNDPYEHHDPHPRPCFWPLLVNAVKKPNGKKTLLGEYLQSSYQ